MGLLTIGCDRFIESQVFFPDKRLTHTPAEAGLEFEEVWFEAGDQTRLHGWWMPGQEGQPVLLFCHGNAGNISHRLDNIVRLHRLGVSVLTFDYRGYGLSQGRVSEKGFYLDAVAAQAQARRRADSRRAKLVVFGRSLGGVAATYIGAHHPCDGLILESTFTHLGAMARVHFHLPFLESGLKKRFRAVEWIGRVEAPVLFIHGDQDDIVPLDLGRALFQAANQPKEFYVLQGAGHNDTYLVGGEAYFAKLRAFWEALPKS